MQDRQKKRNTGGLAAVVFCIWLVMNIRVEAGIGSTLERAIDGLVGVALLAAAVFAAFDFFQLLGRGRR